MKRLLWPIAKVLIYTAAILSWMLVNVTAGLWYMVVTIMIHISTEKEDLQ